MINLTNFRGKVVGGEMKYFIPGCVNREKERERKRTLIKISEFKGK